MGQRRINLQGFLCGADPLFRRTELQRAHIMQPVRQLDEDHPDIPGHGQHHLAQALRLLFFPATELHPRQLRYAVYQHRNLRAELLFDILIGAFGILDHIVQQSGYDGGNIQLHIH